jgi:hypothetical protein
MSSTKRFAAIVMIFGGCLLSGCATSRGIVRLDLPDADKVAASNGIEVYIHSVVDKRIFEKAPKSPNIPSLDPSEPQNEKIKLRAVARKRNAYGKGLGDILLEEGQTVESIINESLRQAFTENGYVIVENNAGMSKDLQVVDVEINKFWSWMNPGFWAITLSTEIATDIRVNGSNTAKKTIHVKAADHYQTGVEGNWLSVMKSALKDYISEVKTHFRNNQGRPATKEIEP